MLSSVYRVLVDGYVRISILMIQVLEVVGLTKGVIYIHIGITEFLLYVFLWKKGHLTPVYSIAAVMLLRVEFVCR